MHLDLGDLSSIKEFALSYKKRYDHLDVLINNAGITRPEGQKTKDGFEPCMGTNYLGPFLLTLLLLDPLIKSGNGR